MQKMDKNVAVIGSGLSAIGAIRALVALGIRPTVLDVGNTLEEQKKEMVDTLSSKKPQEWSKEERQLLSENDTINNGSSIPKKLIFGSDYFYGKSQNTAKVESEGSIPPFSYAKGGLSAGWGAAILPPSHIDIKDWPLSEEELHRYCKLVLEDMDYSSSDDGLSLSFPNFVEKPQGLKMSPTARYIFQSLQKNVPLKKDDTLYGKARLLVNSDEKTGCQYCGECMSGCVYKSIYKSDDEIQKLIDEDKIEYISDALVDKVLEDEISKKVIVEYFDSANNKKEQIFDKIFLACGAVNSSRIILNSLEIYNKSIEVKTRGGFVVPVFSLKSLPISWKTGNSQPGLFLEFRGDGLEHWIHTQVSTDNELLLKKLGLEENDRGFMASIKSFIARHTFLLLVNYNSKHSGVYKLWLKKEEDGSSILKTSHKKSYPQSKVWFASWWKLLKILLKIKCLPIYPFAKLNSGSYHVGASLPMSKDPKELQTDILGRVKGMKNTHIVDTSVFSSLPGTTVGLIAMANAYRIVDQTYKQQDTI